MLLTNVPRNFDVAHECAEDCFCPAAQLLVGRSICETNCVSAFTRLPKNLGIILFWGKKSLHQWHFHHIVLVCIELYSIHIISYCGARNLCSERHFHQIILYLHGIILWGKISFHQRHFQHIVLVYIKSYLGARNFCSEKHFHQIILYLYGIILWGKISLSSKIFSSNHTLFRSNRPLGQEIFVITNIFIKSYSI